VADLTILRIW